MKSLLEAAKDFKKYHTETIELHSAHLWSELYDAISREEERQPLVEVVIETARKEHCRVPRPGISIASCVRPIAGCSVCTALKNLDAFDAQEKWEVEP